MHTLPAGLQAFNVNDPAPTCGRWKDSMPRQRNPESYRLYINARKVWRSKIEYQLTHSEAARILSDVGLAAERGDWGARSLMSYFHLYGLGRLESNRVLEEDPEKSIELVRLAVSAGQAWGYYDLGVAYEHGYGGVPFDKNIAWAYYRRAAELGSPDAQMVLASAYQKAKRWDVEESLRLCAFKQGHGPAAYRLGIRAEVLKDFVAAQTYFQEGVKFGNHDCAISLMFLFSSKEWPRRTKDEQDELRRVGILPAPDRSERYRQISAVLELNPDLRLTRLDKVLPLPPAELPSWNGIEDAVEPETDAPPTY